MTQAILSDNINKVAGALKKVIDADANSTLKLAMQTGVDYYNYRHDILNNHIFFYDGAGVLKEDKHATNTKIPHGFMTELVDQKVQYLLSNPVEVDTEDEPFWEKLQEYYTPRFQQFLQVLLEGASKKGLEYVYVHANSDDVLEFDVADALHTVPIYNDDNVLKRVAWSYTREIQKDSKTVRVHYALVYDDKQVMYFKAVDTGEYKPDDSKQLNPAPHVIAVDDNDTLVGRDFGVIPFYELDNNEAKLSDLAPVKALIDDYDLMNAFLSNNLQDFTDAIYVVKDYEGANLDELITNLRTKKAVGVSREGSLDVKTIDIPVDARMRKMDEDKKNIYKFGFGFDSTQLGDGNITNVVIKSRYSLLDMKANKSETRLRTFLDWANRLITDDINRRFGTAYDYKDIEVIINRSLIVNEQDVAATKQIEEQTRVTAIQGLLTIADRLDDDTLLRLISDEYGLDWEDVKKAKEKEAEQVEPTEFDNVTDDEVDLDNDGEEE